MDERMNNNHVRRMFCRANVSACFWHGAKVTHGDPLSPLHQLNKPAKLCSLATIQLGLIAHSIRVHHSVHSWTSLGQTAGGMSWCNSPQVEHRSPPLPLGCPRSVMLCFARRVSGWRSHPLGEEVYKAIWKFAAILPSWSDGGRINCKWMQMAFINSYGCRFPPINIYQLQIPTLKISKVALVCISWGCKDHQKSRANTRSGAARALPTPSPFRTQSGRHALCPFHWQWSSFPRVLP